MIRFADYDDRHKPSVEQRLHALYPPVNDSGYGSNSQEDSPKDDEEGSIFSLDDFIDWDDNHLVLGSH